MSNAGVHFGTISKTGPGAGYRATSYSLTSDGTHRLVWSKAGLVRIWTLAGGGAFSSSLGYGGPAAPGTWTATGYNLNEDGTFKILWASTDAHLRLWSMNSNGTFSSSIGLGGPVGDTAENFFFR